MDPKSRGLGRGLNALFEDDEQTPASVAAQSGGDVTPSGKGRMTIGIEKIHPGHLQPRQIFDQEAIDQLASSIKMHGLLQPLLVRADSTKPGTYEIIAGERRWRASQKAQLHEVPVLVLDIPDVEVLEVGLVENLQREDLNPVEEAKGYKKLIEEYGHTQEKLAEMIGKSRPHIANTVRLLALPDGVLKHLEKGDLSAGHARALVSASNAQELAKQIISKGLNVRQTEALVNDSTGRVSKKKKSSDAVKISLPGQKKDADTIALETDVSSFLGMRVSIDPTSNEAGVVKIEYKTLSQLDDIVHRLTQLSKVAERLME